MNDYWFLGQGKRFLLEITTPEFFYIEKLDSDGNNLSQLTRLPCEPARKLHWRRHSFVRSSLHSAVDFNQHDPEDDVITLPYLKYGAKTAVFSMFSAGPLGL